MLQFSRKEVGKQGRKEKRGRNEEREMKGNKTERHLVLYIWKVEESRLEQTKVLRGRPKIHL